MEIRPSNRDGHVRLPCHVIHEFLHDEKHSSRRGYYDSSRCDLIRGCISRNAVAATTTADGRRLQQHSYAFKRPGVGDSSNSNSNSERGSSMSMSRFKLKLKHHVHR
jgi:hypothetical protein